MTRTDAFIQERKLSSREVTHINYIIKARARRYVAAGRREWLFPEKTTSATWDDLRATLLPPADELWHFGGEMFAKFESGDVHYQDEFGRTEKQRDFLMKPPLDRPLRPGDLCGCGYGRSFKACCMPKPASLRPSWTERSIRERNVMLQNGIINVLGLREKHDWTSIRRDLTDDQISKVYSLYEGLWPLETDLLSLLPKSDGTPRAVYTGSLHPSAITDFAISAPLYFGELIIQNPFLHAGTVNAKFSPVKNPKAYRQDFLKAVVFFFNVMPLVEAGLVNLIPDPCNFDLHLRDQMMDMAQSRTAGMNLDFSKEIRLEHLMREDFQRTIMSLPKEALRSQFQKAIPGLEAERLEEALSDVQHLREADPLAVLQEDSFANGKKGGQLNMMSLAPNFEMAMYLAQATGASIVTDSYFRWTELRAAIGRRSKMASLALPALARNIARSEFLFPQNSIDVVSLAPERRITAYPPLIRDMFRYLVNLNDREPKSNRESQLAGRFVTIHAAAQKEIKKKRIITKSARISAALLRDGVQDNTVNRLLLMSSSEHHLQNVPMAFFIEQKSE
jgi:hypothetical protein